jgi:integrase/recombinase XerD
VPNGTPGVYEARYIDSEERLTIGRASKVAAVCDFFAYTGKTPDQVTTIDVKTWQADLEGRGLAPATVYARVSRVSSFFAWAMTDPGLQERIHSNPVNLARPKAPRAYQSDSTQALTDDELMALLAVVRAKADGGDVVGKRDYALLLFYVTTGLRRAEVINLSWGDLKLNGTIVFTAKFKGGDYASREVAEPSVKAALLDYLTASGRLDSLTPDSPLWVNHDRRHEAGAALTGHGFVKNLKRYAAAAGLGAIHLHQTRHTFARMVSEDSGSMLETQDALGHKNAATTRVYVQRVGVKKDKVSAKIAGRLGL